jgi:hypothetical protein
VGPHSSALELGGEKQFGWAGSDDEHCGLMAWKVHRRKVSDGSCQPGYLLARKRFDMFVGVLREDPCTDANAATKEGKTRGEAKIQRVTW